MRPLVFTLAALAATSASAGPSVTAEVLDSMAVAVISSEPGDMCPIPAVPRSPSGTATAVITTAPGGGIASVSVRAPDGLALVFERAARRCVPVAGPSRQVRVEYRWWVAP